MEKIIKPKIMNELEKKRINECPDFEKINDTFFENEKLSKKLNVAEFNGCKFKNVDFSKYPLVDVDFIDCVFESCDLSNMDINKKLLLRVDFINSSLVGSNIVDSSVRNVVFRDCNMDYANISSTFKSSFFDSCTMKFSRLFENNFTDVRVEHCDLSNAEIFKTKLEKMDLSTSILDDVTADHLSVTGISVDIGGMINISKIFGINIK